MWIVYQEIKGFGVYRVFNNGFQIGDVVMGLL